MCVSTRRSEPEGARPPEPEPEPKPEPRRHHVALRVAAGAAQAQIEPVRFVIVAAQTCPHDGGVVVEATAASERASSNHRRLRTRILAISRLTFSLPRSHHRKWGSVGRSGRARDLAQAPHPSFDAVLNTPSYANILAAVAPSKRHAGSLKRLNSDRLLDWTRPPVGAHCAATRGAAPQPDKRAQLPFAGARPEPRNRHPTAHRGPPRLGDGCLERLRGRWRPPLRGRAGWGLRTGAAPS